MSFEALFGEPHPRPRVAGSARWIVRLCVFVAVSAGFACDDEGFVRDDATALSRVKPTSVEAAAARSATAERDPPEPRPPAKERVPRCPRGMVHVPGGKFRVGTPAEVAGAEESPQFVTVVAPFCLERTEVTVAAYEECVDRGRCTPAGTEARQCNSGNEHRRAHPINCVDWDQSKAYCEFRGWRLPTEIEWEFAARGGDEYRKYSWGNERPSDALLCWKRGNTCPVGAFEQGAFGLVDMAGNVWEWTSSAFGRYPWPPIDPKQRVYRGGSWSRRFAKWIRPQLRNRWPPDKLGSHLGLRCALTAPGAACAYGRTEDGVDCLHGVTDVECGGNERWNGARCAPPGAPECARGRKLAPGHGCVLELEPARTATGAETTKVTRARTPSFDSDCAKHYPGRPLAFRYAGGTHASRNHTGGQAGCKNRDVGVGWNSTCCP